MSTELAPPPHSSSSDDSLTVPLSGPELGALGDRVGASMEAVVEAVLRRLRGEYVEPLLALLEDCPRWLAAPDDALEIPVPPEDRMAERQQYVCAVEGTKQLLADQVVELLASATLRATEDTADALALSLAEELDQIAGTLPVLGEADQEEHHFISEPIETRRLRLLKAVKRAMRPLRGRWTRAVPVAGLARLVSAQLLDEAGPALADLRRLRVRVLVAVAQELRAALELIDRRCASALVGTDTAALKAAAGEARADDSERRARRIAFQQDVAEVEAALRGAAVRAGERFAVLLDQVGTVECPASTADEARVGRRHLEAGDRRRARAARWTAYEQALANGLLADGEVISLAAALHDAVGNMIGDVQEMADQRVRAPLGRLERRLQSACDRAESALATGDADAEALSVLRGEVAGDFTAALEPLRGDSDLGEALRQHGQRLIELIATLPRVVPERCALAPISEEDVPEEPGQIALREAPLRALAELHCGTLLPRELREALVPLQPDYDGLRAEVERMEQAIDFNLASAIEGLAANTPGAQRAAQDLVCGVLQRSARRLADRARASRALDGSVAEGVRSGAAATAGELSRLVRSRDVGAMQSAILRSGATIRLSAGVEAGRRASSVAVVQVKETLAGARQRVATGRDWIGRRLGVAPGDRVEARLTLEDAVIDERTLADLPLAYRQLFAADPLEWRGFTVGREAELAVIERAYRRWRDGGASSVALFGEKGSGKTTLVHTARQQLLGQESVRSLVLESTVRDEMALRQSCATLFGEDEPLPLSQLAERLRRRGERVVAVLENSHHLFLRRIAGFDVLQDFLAFLRATRDTVLWLVTMEQYAWRYLERTVAIQDSFVHELHTTNLAPAKIQEAILVRHHMSGYGLHFEPDARLRRSRRYRRLGTQRQREQAAQRFFFDELARIAEGNIWVALFYWLRSIAAVEEQALTFRTPRVLEASFLDTLPLATLHTVAAVIQHGSLDVEEHAEVFQLQPRESERMLWALGDARLLRATGDGVYAINPVLYRPFVRLLREKNIFS